jgi:hypothetical protein
MIDVNKTGHLMQLLIAITGLQSKLKETGSSFPNGLVDQYFIFNIAFYIFYFQYCFLINKK